MDVLKVGEVIRQRREDLRISQEELCSGICEVSTLSRLENNKQQPSMRVFTALAERLGLPSERFVVLGTEEDFRTKQLCTEIIERHVVFRYAETAELIAQLEKSPQGEERPLKQFILRSKALSLKGHLTPEQFEEKILEAIHVTLPNFDEETFEKHILNMDELKCVMNLGNSYAERGDFNRAIQIYYKALTIADKNYQSGEEKSKFIPTISYSLSKNLIYQKRYEEALEVCDKAIWVCIRNRRTERLPHLYMNKGCVFCSTGRRDEGKKAFILAYYMFLGIQDYQTAEALVEGIKKEYDMEINFLLDNHE